MKNLLAKEFRLTANPLSFIFIAFGFMTLIPNYPILVGGFFVCLGIFYTFQSARESDDITYTVLLPVRKADVVYAKYWFSVIIELCAFVLAAVLAVVRMTVLKNAAVYQDNALLNANLTYLGSLLIIYGLFNVVFLGGFFKTAYKLGIPFVKFCVAGFVVIAVVEVLHHMPGLAALNAPSLVGVSGSVTAAGGILGAGGAAFGADTANQADRSLGAGGVNWGQVAVLVLGAVWFALGTVLSARRAAARFQKLDLA